MYLDKAVALQLDAVNIVLITTRNTAVIRLHVEDVPVLLAVLRHDDSLLTPPQSPASILMTSTDLDIHWTLMLSRLTSATSMIVMKAATITRPLFVNVFLGATEIILGAAPILALRLPGPAPVDKEILKERAKLTIV